ncbi:MAG TPA: hypothetical protein VFR02_05760, partial [bacterium]|nr:hypothetical protein [bacterium]
MGRPAKRPDRFFPALPWAFAAAAWLPLAAQAPALVHRLACPQQVQQEEAVNVEFGRVLLRGERLYPDIRVGGPYLHCSYPPLFPFLESLLMRLTPDPWAPGRSLAFAGFLACGLMLGGAVWRRWRDPAWA